MSLLGNIAKFGLTAAKFNPWTVGLSVGGSLLANKLFGGKNDDKANENPEAPFTQQLQESSANLRQQGSEFSGMSAEALGPTLQYLKGILGPDAGGILDATRASRGRVMDQYDTARQTIAQFGPRGGGTTSALAQSRFNEAESLADLTSTARNEALGMSGQIGTAFAGLGLSAEQLASADLNSVIQAVLAREGFDVAKRGQTMGLFGDIGEAAGTILGAKIGAKS